NRCQISHPSAHSASRRRFRAPCPSITSPSTTAAPSAVAAVSASLVRRPSAPQPRDILGGRPLLTLYDVELNALSLVQALDSVTLNGVVMHEQILTSVLGRDEAEALVIVEPLHGSFHRHSVLALEIRGLCTIDSFHRAKRSRQS